MNQGEELVLESVEAVLAATPADVADALAEGDAGEAALRRQGLESLTALALALPNEAAPERLKLRLLASLVGDETQRVPQLRRGGGLDALDPPVAAGGAATVPRRPATGAALPPPRPGQPLALPRPSRWRLVLPVAAGLAAAVLAVASGLLWRELEASRGRLVESERVRQRLAAQVEQMAAHGAQEAKGAAALEEMRERLAMVTATSTEVCALRPPGARAAAPAAKALLYVAEDHQHWYLRAEGLGAPAEGRAYHLWFVVGERPVNAGVFVMEGNEAVMSSPTMPAGTSAALVTLEPGTTPGERPSGPVVLYGKDFVKL